MGFGTVTSHVDPAPLACIAFLVKWDNIETNNNFVLPISQLLLFQWNISDPLCTYWSDVCAPGGSGAQQPAALPAAVRGGVRGARAARAAAPAPRPRRPQPAVGRGPVTIVSIL